MKIAILQASSQKDKNQLLVECVQKAVAPKEYEVINFGIFPEEEVTFSYVQTAFCISLLLGSGVVDFIVTGCSSGQGMMLACNSFPDVLCGYIDNPSDAYLFGRINNGNAISYPLGLNFGWAAEINMQSTFDKLFEEPFGIGYPKEDAARKKKDAALLKEINTLSKRSMIEILPELDAEFVQASLRRHSVFDFIMENSLNEELKAMLEKYRKIESDF